MKKNESVFRKVFKIILKSVLTFAALILLYLGVAFIVSRITLNKKNTETTSMSIYIINNGVHTDIVMPVKTDIIDWSKKVPYANTIAKDSTMPWVSMGWGDKGFYLETETWADLKPKVAFNAAFGFSNTAIHVTYYASMIEGDRCRKIDLSTAQYQNLTKYICETFYKDSIGNYTYINTNMQYGNNDAFYDANGSYSLFNTCNSWANNALKSANLKACLWTAFCDPIFLKYPLN